MSTGRNADHVGMRGMRGVSTVSVSVMWPKYSRTIFSMVSNASATMLRCLSVAAVVNTCDAGYPGLGLVKVRVRVRARVRGWGQGKAFFFSNV